MMQSGPTWPIFNFKYSNSTLDFDTLYDQEMDFSSCSFDCSVISSNSYVPNMFSDKFFFDFKHVDDEIQFCSAIDEVETISSQAIEEICEWINEDETETITMEGHEWSPCLSFEPNSPFSLTATSSLVLPGDDMEVDDHLTLVHLLRAYGEAMENGEKGLTEELVRSINEKSSPLGDTMERVAYNLFQSRESQGEDIRNEAKKNIAEAFKVVYQSLPNGKFAHFTANSAILESMPKDAEILQVVDFDMGEGIQWPPLVEALSRKQNVIMKITSVRSEEGPSPNSSCWEFEDTKRQLLAHARLYGSKLQIEEKSIEDVCRELRMNGKGQRKEWWVFNCSVGLPHMGRRRTRKSVDEFLKVAKELVPDLGGILILGDGEAREDLNCGYASYFDYLLRHYQALFESLERNFPAYLAEARTAVESLFLAPFMCPVSWFQDWDEMRKGHHFVAEGLLEGRKLSLESLAEAKEMVVEGENSYNVKMEGMRVHEMVLQWKETPLVRVSTWM